MCCGALANAIRMMIALDPRQAVIRYDMNGKAVNIGCDAV